MSEYEALQRELAAGWNTWNTFSVFSHVHLPEGFALNLAFRDAPGRHFLREGFIGYYKQTEELDLTLPGPRSYDGRYTELDVTWRGSRFTVRSATDGDDQVLLVRPEGGESARPPLMAVEGTLLWGRDGMVGRDGDELVVRCGDAEFHAFVTAELLDEPYMRSDAPCLVGALDAPVGVSTGRPRALAEIEYIVDARREEVIAGRRRYGDLEEVYTAMQTCMAWNTVYDPLHDRVISPVSRLWSRNWNGYVLFCWDTYFAAVIAGLDNRELAYANAVEMTREITERGFVPNYASGCSGSSEDRSQPPVGSRAVLDLYRRYGDEWFLAEVFDDLLRWNRWWPENRMTGRWLGWGSNSYVNESGESSGGSLAGAVFESGLDDNSPLYDKASFDQQTEVMQLADVGLNGMYVADCRCLAEMAKVLGRDAEAAELKERGDRFAHALGELWDEERGIYLNRYTDSGRPSSRLAPTNFYPMLGGVPSAEQARRMVEEHLLNAEVFWSNYVVPSCSRNTPGYQDQEQWRGCVWGPLNMLVYWGLREYDVPEARRKLAERSADLLLKEWREKRHVHENYNAETGVGCIPRSNPFYHWGGLLGLISLTEAGHYRADS